MKPKTTKNSAPFAKSVSARMILFVHWIVKNESLKKLSSKSLGPVSRQLESTPEYIRKLQEHLEKWDRLRLQIQRIEGYLGRDRKAPAPDAVEAASWIVAARWVRAFVENGESDEFIAGFLERMFSAKGRRSNQHRGRPLGAMSCDGVALDALVLHDMNPKLWTWPRLADELLMCVTHGRKHTSEHECTTRLRKAGERLRAFLKEL